MLLLDVGPFQHDVAQLQALSVIEPTRTTCVRTILQTGKAFGVVALDGIDQRLLAHVGKAGRLAPRHSIHGVGDGLHPLVFAWRPGRERRVPKLLRRLLWLAIVVAGALALVLPSQLEGFGLPPLEAALHATPSVLSDLPVFDETLGDAALRVPAGDAHALAAALCTIESDPGLRARLGAQARARAQRYSWAAGAAVLYDVLREAAR